MKNVRCINLDWLEVYCLEPVTSPRDADYFRSRGLIVHERDYGTRVYSQMFTIEGTDGLPLLEVRREPKSALSQGGILPINACHLRLVNRTCYYDDAAMQLEKFMQAHQFTFQRIARVDICLDFERFDTGDYPEKFLTRYLKGTYAKINQARIHSHGEDAWTKRTWNSISWGHPKSQIGTKIYNKTQELREVKDKPYIRQSWFLCGLVDDPQQCTKTRPDGTTYTPDIWRLEFSIRSDVKNWFVMEQEGDFKKKRSIPNTLSCYYDRQRILAIFMSLVQHYFHFKHVAQQQQKMKLRSLPNYGLTSTVRAAHSDVYNNLADITPRKDRCPDKILFRWSPDEPVYHVEHPAGTLGRDQQIRRLMTKLQEYRQTHTAIEVNKAVQVLLQSLAEDELRNDLINPWSRSELAVLRAAIHYRQQHHDIDPATIITSLQAIVDSRDGDIF